MNGWKEFVFGQRLDGKGAGLVEGFDKREIKEEHLDELTGYRGDSTRLTYLPFPKEGVYYFSLATRMKNGSSVHNRSQIFAHIYALSKKQVLDLMERPEKIFDIEFYRDLNAYHDDIKFPLLEFGKDLEDCTEVEAVEKTCFYTALENASKKQCKAFLVMKDVEKNGLKTLVEVLKLFPPEVAIDIPFCINGATVYELNNYEWCFLEQKVYQERMDNNYQSGVNHRRKIVDEGTMKFRESQECKMLFETYKQLGPQIHYFEGDRTEFYDFIYEAMEERFVEPEMDEDEFEDAANEIVKSKNQKEKCHAKQKFHRHRSSQLRREAAVLLAEICVIGISIAYLVMRTYVDCRVEIPYIDINIKVDNSTLLFLLQYVVVFATIGVVGQIKKLRSKYSIYDK